MNLPNIHAVRKSFHSVCNLCISSADPSCWLSLVESSQWLQNISMLLNAACHIVKVMDKDCQPVVVHCSDGWDRTPQLTSLAQIMLDPFYRTVPVS
jgi:protein tyrosine phosphatase